MSETMKGKTLLKGHTLYFEGRVIGRCYGSNGVGRGKCSCGEESPELSSTPQRKKWHREHKEEMKLQPVAGTEGEVKS